MEIKEFKNGEKYNITDLLEIMKVLRSPNGCPWDKEQTHKSIRRDFLEECYEAIEAIDTQDVELLKEELGDVLLQVVFHCQIAVESNEFDFEQVVDGLCKKLIVRHPHVFGNTIVSDTSEVLYNWDEIKKATKGQKNLQESCESISKALPSIVRHQKFTNKLIKNNKFIQNTIDISSNLDTINKVSIGRSLAQIVEIAELNKIDAEEALASYTNGKIKNL